MYSVITPSQGTACQITDSRNIWADDARTLFGAEKRTLAKLPCTVCHSCAYGCRIPEFYSHCRDAVLSRRQRMSKSTVPPTDDLFCAFWDWGFFLFLSDWWRRGFMLTNRAYVMLSIVEDEEERGKEGRKNAATINKWCVLKVWKACKNYGGLSFGACVHCEVRAEDEGKSEHLSWLPGVVSQECKKSGALCWVTKNKK